MYDFPNRPLIWLLRERLWRVVKISDLLRNAKQGSKRIVINNRTWEAFGFGTQYAWLLAVIFCGALSDDPGSQLSHFVRISIPCALALCNAGVFLLRDKLNFNLHFRTAVISMGCVQALGTLVMALAPLTGNAEAAVAVLGSIAASAGFSVHMICGNVYWSNIRSERVMVHMGASATCGIIACGLIMFFPLVFRVMALFGLPLIGSAILANSKRTQPRGKTFRRVNPLVRGMVPRVMFFVATYGFCVGLLLGLACLNASANLQISMLSGAFLAALLALFFALNLAPSTMLKALFGIGGPAMIAGCSFLIADTRALVPAGGEIGCALLMGGFVACDLFMWFLNAEMVARTDKSPAEVLARSCMFEWAFMTCGALTVVCLGMPGHSQEALAFHVMLILLVIVFAFVFSAHQAGILADARVKDEEAPKENVYALLAEQHGLSQRESEVFELLATGRSVPYIQNELVISQNTVKTHTRNIYRKMGVSNKQELINLVVKTNEA